MQPADYSVLSLVVAVVGLSVLSALGATLFFVKIFGAPRLRDAGQPPVPVAPTIDTDSDTTVEATDLDPASLVAANLPYPSWIRTKDGEIAWINDRLSLLLDDQSDGAGAATNRLPPAFKLQQNQNDPIDERRVVITTHEDGEDIRQWFHLHEVQADDQNILGIALSVDKLVSVENTLSRFVATLTESFAHLSTGLIIFDHERRVTIFNPALADTMKLDPGWLATGPTFRELMSRIREVQMLPEQKTTKDWHAFVSSIEQSAEEGNLNVEWILPSGQTLKLTGRPHPHGAIVLMIEDITDGVHLETRYRSELEQSRATLEYLTEAVCVFDTAGVLIYCNSACENLWGFDPRTLTEGADILSMTARWSSLSEATPVWGDLREFVTSLEQRTSWSATIDSLGGAQLQATFAPLPDGSTLTAFAEIASPTRAPIALVETSFEADMQQLVDGTGLALAFSFDGATTSRALSAELTQILLCMVLVARDFGKSDQCVDFTIANFDTGTSMACMFMAETGQDGPALFEDDLAYRMMKRLLSRLGGDATITHFDQRDAVQISCTVPAARMVPDLAASA